MTVYYANAPVPQGPHTSSGPPGWTSAGCWADGPNKALANGVDVPGGGDNMTVTECTSACGAAGYTLAGVEYASKSSFGCAYPGVVVPILERPFAHILLQVNAFAIITSPRAQPTSRSKIATCPAMVTLASSVAPETI